MTTKGYTAEDFRSVARRIDEIIRQMNEVGSLPNENIVGELPSVELSTAPLVSEHDVVFAYYDPAKYRRETLEKIHGISCQDIQSQRCDFNS